MRLIENFNEAMEPGATIWVTLNQSNNPWFDFFMFRLHFLNRRWLPINNEDWIIVPGLRLPTELLWVLTAPESLLGLKRWQFPYQELSIRIFDPLNLHWELPQLPQVSFEKVVAPPLK